MRWMEAAAAMALIGLMALPAAAADKREPPSCAAIRFRPIPSGLSDGIQDAGLYKSRFGRIDVKANVKNGAAQSYFVDVNGTKLAARAELPKAAATCAKVKRLGAPIKPLEPCSGDALTVLITHSGDKRYFMLYAHSSGSWRYCSGGSG